jgi:hypothetical protein
MNVNCFSPRPCDGAPRLGPPDGLRRDDRGFRGVPCDRGSRLSASAGFLKGVLDLVFCRPGVPGDHLPAQLQRGVAGGDLLQQRSRGLLARPVSRRNTHALGRALRHEVGPLSGRRGLSYNTQPVDGLKTHRVEPATSHGSAMALAGREPVALATALELIAAGGCGPAR